MSYEQTCGDCEQTISAAANYCPFCGEPTDREVRTDGGHTSSGTERWCDACEDETPHRQVGDSSAPGPTYQCLACPERVEIEAALGLGDRSRETGDDR